MALYYGVAGFGGGYSVLSQLRRDLVEERAWLPADDFLVLAELSKSLPGTPATTLLTLLGQRVAGVRGGLIAACAFLLPSMILMMALGSAYTWIRGAPAVGLFFDGMNAAMVGVIAATTLDLGKSALRGPKSVAAAVVCGAILATRILSEPSLAFAAIAVGALQGLLHPKTTPAPTPPAAGGGTLLCAGWTSLVWIVGGLGVLSALARVFVPIGIMTFGGGLAMVPAIEHTVVMDQHWLDRPAFADAVALGQITPGPVAICATFIGYRVGGVPGALVATVAMFGPAIFLALAVGSSVERFRRSPIVEGALHTLAPAVIGMLGAATFSLGRSAFVGGLSVAIAVASFAALQRKGLTPLWPLAIGGLVQIAAGGLAR